MTTLKKANKTTSNAELNQAEADAHKNRLSKEWAKVKAKELQAAGDEDQASDFLQYLNGSLSYETLQARWAYKHWTVDTIDRGVVDPYLPASTMTKRVYVDRGSYLHPLNSYHQTLGKQYLESRGKTLVQDGEDYYLV